MSINIFPLTLYVAVKQDEATQGAVGLLLGSHNKGGLLPATILHFVRLVGVPNTGVAGNKGYAGIMLITTFDTPMSPYLQFFWKQDAVREGFKAIYAIAQTPPASPPEYDVFYEYITKNNLSPADSLFYAYTAPATAIVKQFPPQ